MMRTRVTAHNALVRGGFSLFELIMVMVIIVTLAAIAVPRYAASTARYRADVTARRVVADLALAREKAYGSSRSRTVTFDLAANEVTISGVSHLDDASSAYSTDLSGEPYRAKLLSADFAGAAQVVFDIYGAPDSPGQVVIETGGVQKTIVLDATSGKAAVQ